MPRFGDNYYDVESNNFNDNVSQKTDQNKDQQKETKEVNQQKIKSFEEELFKKKNYKTKMFQNIEDFINADGLEKINHEEVVENQFINEANKNSIPIFYKKELNSIRIKVVVWSLLLLFGLCSTSYLIYDFVSKSLFEGTISAENYPFSPWVFLPIAIYISIILFLLGMSLSNLINFKQEIKYQNNNFDQNKATNFIKFIYSKLIVSHININWISAYIYLTSAVFIALIFVVVYFYNLYQLGGKDPESYFGQMFFLERNKNTINIVSKNPYYAIIALGSLVGLTFILHLWLIFNAYHRVNRIHSYYREDILSEDQVIQLKKIANRRGLIIFLVLSIILAILFFVAYSIIKKRFSAKKG